MEDVPETKNTKSKGVSTVMTVVSVVGGIIGLLFAIGAGKLSYDRYGSIFWAIVAFFFAPIYYVYYAFFVSKSSYATGLMAGGRRMKW
jgi:hypothetical protein